MKVNVRNRFFLATDVLGWLVIPTVALALRLDGFSQVGVYSGHLLLFTAVAVVSKPVVQFVAGLYQRYWLYASVDELALVILGSLSASVVAGAAYFGLRYSVELGGDPLPRSIPLIDALLSLVWVGGTRFAVRLAARISVSSDAPRGKRVLIVGAGEAGMVVAKELRGNRDLDMELVGFIDDDRGLRNYTILSLPVLGTSDQIPQIAREHKVDCAIIAIPSRKDLCRSWMRRSALPQQFSPVQHRYQQRERGAGSGCRLMPGRTA